MIMSSFTLVNNLYCLSFFEGGNVDMAVDKAPIRNC